MAGGSSRRRFDVQLFEWALNLSDRIHGDAGIAGRRIDVAMAKQPRGIMRSFYVIET
jgi:hypothetical protein